MELVEKAYYYAKRAHEGQKRASGEPYFVHPYNVALILADLMLDAATIAGGLLHDVVEDCGVAGSVIGDEFGQEVALLVDGVTKLTRLDFSNKEERQTESIRKMILAMARDMRVVLIKLADRLHNMRTLEYRAPDKQLRVARETLDIYAPLAHRLGIYTIKGELEDLCLKYIDEKMYNELIERLGAEQAVREARILHVIETLHKRLEEEGIKADISGRPKHIYSIYKKMVLQNRPFEQIYDILAIRVIVDNVGDCYSALGIVHTYWHTIPGRYKDYISVPKPNNYQSLHTSVLGEEGMPFEVQIRTWDMHSTAEYGIAAHWRYKEGRQSASDLDDRMRWMRRLLDWQNDVRDSKDFVEQLKVDLFADTVLVFTPKGEVIDMPKGATPIDYAYRIHSAVGNKCVGCKVNGRMVQLNTELQTGDIVEILTAPSARGPSLDWLKIVKTTQAKNRINAWFRRELKDEHIVRGREALEREARRQGVDFNRLFKTEYIEVLNKRYGFSAPEDMYAAVGYAAVTSQQIVNRLMEEERKHEKSLAAKSEGGIGDSEEKGCTYSHHGRGRVCSGRGRHGGAHRQMLHAGAGGRYRGLRYAGPGRLGASAGLQQYAGPRRGV